MTNIKRSGSPLHSELFKCGSAYASQIGLKPFRQNKTQNKEKTNLKNTAVNTKMKRKVIYLQIQATKRASVKIRLKILNQLGITL